MEQQKQKTKVRFTSIDITAIVSDLKSKLLGLRVTNIYDLNPSTYLFKFAKADQKNYLICQNGVRFHLTQTKAQKNKMPSGFTMKFRKFLRSKRLENIRQVGMERVVVLTFGSQNFTNHLILELYSQGNIILTDSDYRIIQCIRSHEFSPTVKTAVGQLYPFEYAANIYLETLNTTKQKILEILKQNEAKQIVVVQQQKQQQNAKGKKNKKKKQVQKKTTYLKLKEIVFKLVPCLFPQVIDHILQQLNLNGNQKCKQQNIELISKAAQQSVNWIKKFKQQKPKGYLLINNQKIKAPIKAQKQKQTEKEKSKENDKEQEEKIQQQQKERYFQYLPFLHKSYEKKPYKQIQSFSKAVDIYYQNFKKSEDHQQFQELAWKKYQQIKNDQQSRVNKLRSQQEQYQIKAQLIEKNVQDVDAIIKIVKTMLQNGYSWNQIQKMIHQSKKSGDPLANIIHTMNLQKKSVVLLLGDPINSEQHFDLVAVDVNIDYNAYTNATIYYESRKKNYQKQIRTKEASQHVLKIAQKQALKDIQKKKNQRQHNVINTRKPYWFEKFYWFISSENYLVISGRDSHQNQIIVKKYMKAGDLYMHSDYGGAASTIIKNPTKEPVPRFSLEQAAIFTVCRSKAWQTKIISGSWWVYHDQVSKSAPTGQFLPTGSFMIRGKKNFVYPNRMEMGVTLLYKIDKQSLQRHLNDRTLLPQVKIEQQRSQIQKAHQQKSQQEQYSIINLEAVSKKKPQQQQSKKGGNKDSNQQKPTLIKQQNSDESGSQDDQEQNVQQKNKKNQTKKPSVKEEKKKTQNLNQQQQQQQAAKKNQNQKKLKKLQKYLQQQDQEERQVIMKMIGAKEMKHMRDSDQQEIQQKNKKSKKGANNKQKQKKKDKYNFEEKIETKIDVEKVLFLQQEQIKKQKKFQKVVQQKKVEIIEKQQQKNEENPSEKDESEQQIEEKQPQIKQNYEEDQKTLDSDINQISKLVSKVYPQDVYDALIVMCAPYQTIAQNRFKIKLMPGGLKKGKAARNILNYFTTIDLNQKEKMLLRGVPEQQLINALLSNVKLGGAGLLKLEMKEKAQKKQKRKQKQKKQKEKNDKDANKKK